MTNGIWGSPHWWDTPSWVEWGELDLKGGAHLWCSWGFAGLGGAHCGLAGSLALFPAHNQDHMLWKTVRKRERPKNKLNHRKPPNQTTDNQNNNNNPLLPARQGRPRWTGQEGAAGNWSPCSNLLWQSTAKFFLWLGVQGPLCSHLNFSLQPQLTHSFFSSHTGWLWALPNETMLGPSLPWGSLPLFFPGACKIPPPSLAACEKPLQPSRHSSNVTSFTKLSLILHKPQSILLVHLLWPLFNK